MLLLIIQIVSNKNLGNAGWHYEVPCTGRNIALKKFQSGFNDNLLLKLSAAAHRTRLFCEKIIVNEGEKA